MWRLLPTISSLAEISECEPLRGGRDEGTIIGRGMRVGVVNKSFE
jgi:hypothetical protein